MYQRMSVSSPVTPVVARASQSTPQTFFPKIRRRVVPASDQRIPQTFGMGDDSGFDWGGLFNNILVDTKPLISAAAQDIAGNPYTNLVQAQQQIAQQNAALALQQSQTGLLSASTLGGISPTTLALLLVGGLGAVFLATR